MIIAEPRLLDQDDKILKTSRARKYTDYAWSLRYDAAIDQETSDNLNKSLAADPQLQKLHKDFM